MPDLFDFTWDFHLSHIFDFSFIWRHFLLHANKPTTFDSIDCALGFCCRKGRRQQIWRMKRVTITSHVSSTTFCAPMMLLCPPWMDKWTLKCERQLEDVDRMVYGLWNTCCDSLPVTQVYHAMRVGCHTCHYLCQRPLVFWQFGTGKVVWVCTSDLNPIYLTSKS